MNKTVQLMSTSCVGSRSFGVRRESGAIAPHSTTLARSAEYHAESPQFWSAPRQRRFPTVAGELVLRGSHPPRLIISIFLWLVGSYPTGECKAASLSSE